MNIGYQFVVFRCIIFCENSLLEDFGLGLVVISSSGVCLIVVYCQENESIVIIFFVNKFSLKFLRGDVYWIFIDKVVIFNVNVFFEGLFGV